VLAGGWHCRVRRRGRGRVGGRCAVFTLWARFSLGTMWSVAPKVKGDHQLRTHGPYAVTRHPIYTGLLGMMLGATLLAGSVSGSCSSRSA
jgi:protein-S-isoprenylcysteine O-methyltransferase Ste14